MATTEETITLEPNYDALFQRFMQDAELHANRALNLRGDSLSVVRDLVVSLSIACSSISSTTRLEEFRKALGDMTEQLARRDDESKAEIEDVQSWLGDHDESAMHEAVESVETKLRQGVPLKDNERTLLNRVLRAVRSADQ